MANTALYKTVLARITPSVPIKKKVNVVLSALKKAIGKKKIQIMVGGSVGKDTYLAGDYDCDIFVRFDYDIYQDKLLSDELEKFITSAKLPMERVHGSRDYFQGDIEGVWYEIVPVLKIKSPAYAKNVTDMSPMHVQWVVKRTDQKLKDQLRIMRAFCKAQRVYGAESFIGGFSGHVLDVLTVHYGGFEKFLKAASAWNVKDVVDPMKFFKGKDPLPLLNPSKTVSPLIVIDPILSDRNAASALTKEKFDRLIVAAKKFLKKPHLSFFDRTELTILNFTKSESHRFSLSVLPIEGKTDVVGAKLMQIKDHVLFAAKKHHFTIECADWTWDSEVSHVAEFFFSVKEGSLPDVMDLRGPPITMEAACFMFKREHEDVKTVDGRLVATEPRRFTTFFRLLDGCKHDHYVTSRCRSIVKVEGPIVKKK